MASRDQAAADKLSPQASTTIWQARARHRLGGRCACPGGVACSQVRVARGVRADKSVPVAKRASATLPSSGPQEQPAGQRCSRESFLRPTCHPAHPLRPRAFPQPLACILSRLGLAFLVSCHVAGPPPQKQDREQESDGLHRRGLDPEDSARKPENLLAFAAMAAQESAGWTAPAPPDANTFRVFISTDNHLGFAEVRAGRPRRTAAAPSRLCAAAGSRGCERRRSRLLTHPLQKAEYEPRRDDSFRAVEEVLTNATAAKVCTCFGRCARERKFARRCLAARMRGCRGAHQAYAVPCTPNE